MRLRRALVTNVVLPHATTKLIQKNRLNKLINCLIIFIIGIQLKLLSASATTSSNSAADQYYGTLIGKFSLREHQVRGTVYAINTTSLLLRDFIYDGQGHDAYFFIGTGDTPSGGGTLLRDERGTTNRLEKYNFEDIVIHVPPGKQVNEYAWLSVWDVEKARSYGDVVIPKGFEPPKAQPLGTLQPSDTDTLDSKRVHSGQVVVLNSKTVVIENFYFSGTTTNAVIMVGVGRTPTVDGLRVPLSNGFERLQRSDGFQQLRLRLPSVTNVFSIDWLSVFDVDRQRSMAHVAVPTNLNVPPDLSQLTKLPYSRLPNCETLHPILQVRWEIFGTYLTVELTGVIERDEYMAFGISENLQHSRMLGGDAAIAWYDGLYAKATDYYLGHKTFCTADARGGVCADNVLAGGVDDVQAIEGHAYNGITTITYRRPLNTSLSGGLYDVAIDPTRPMAIIWAIGKLDEHDKPTMHFLYSVSDRKFTFGRVPVRNCDIFDVGARPPRHAPWPPVRLSATHSNVFVAHLGPAGGTRGYTAITRLPTWGTVWYINGTLAPELFVVRGQTYRFIIFGGRNAATFESFHPLYLTSNEHGGIGQLPSDAIEHRNERIFAGARRNAHNVLLPTAYGALCRWQMRDAIAAKMNVTFLLADQFDTFAGFRARLVLACDAHAAEKPGVLEWTPTAHTPDVVYYQSFSHINMGWRIQVLDTWDDIFKRISPAEATDHVDTSSSETSSSASFSSSSSQLLAVSSAAVEIVIFSSCYLFSLLVSCTTFAVFYY